MCKIRTGDEGQRYEARYKNGKNKEGVIGWTDSEEALEGMRKSVELHPVWHSFRFIDRQEK